MSTTAVYPKCRKCGGDIVGDCFMVGGLSDRFHPSCVKAVPSDIEGPAGEAAPNFRNEATPSERHYYDKAEDDAFEIVRGKRGVVLQQHGTDIGGSTKKVISGHELRARLLAKHPAGEADSTKGALLGSSASDDLIERLRQENAQAQKTIEALNICLVQDDERAATLQQRVDELERERDEAKKQAACWFGTHDAHRKANQSLGDANSELFRRAYKAEQRVAALEVAVGPLMDWLTKLEAEFSDTDDDTILGGIAGISVTFGDLRRVRAALSEV